MPREIKFRAWDTKRKEWTSAVNVHIEAATGHLYWCFGDNPCEFMSAAQDKSPFILCQYTGLKDKNGKEIYEGDLVQHIGDPKHPVFLIKWDDEWAQFRWHWLGVKDIGVWGEVIGNLWENPELAKEGK